MKRLLIAGLLCLLCLSTGSVFAQGTLVDVAEDDLENRFVTLLAAVDAAGLTSTLEQDELTLFAPTNGAFLTLLRKLEISEGELLSDADLLNEVLLYHLLPGRVTFADLEELASQRNDGVVVVRTLGGERLRLEVDANADRATLNQGSAFTVEIDLGASNGVIHVIDNVLLPEESPLFNEEAAELEIVRAGATEEASAADAETIIDLETAEGTIADIIADTEDLSILAAAVSEANLVSTLEDPNDDEEEDNIGFTVFAPTDQAFRNLMSFVDITEDELLASDVLEDILRYHVVEGVRTSEQFPDLERPLETIIEGGAIRVRVTGDDGIILNNLVDVIQRDVPAENGVIHAIDDVLLPQEAIEAFGL